MAGLKKCQRQTKGASYCVSFVSFRTGHRTDIATDNLLLEGYLRKFLGCVSMHRKIVHGQLNSPGGNSPGRPAAQLVFIFSLWIIHGVNNSPATRRIPGCTGGDWWRWLVPWLAATRAQV